MYMWFLVEGWCVCVVLVVRVVRWCVSVVSGGRLVYVVSGGKFVYMLCLIEGWCMCGVW